MDGKNGQDVQEVKQAASGRWRDILPRTAGIDADLLDGRGHPCPKCDGDDRFSTFKDFNETGGVICRKCFSTNNSDGFAAIQHYTGCTFPEAVRSVAEYLGIASANGNGRAKTPDTASKADGGKRKTYETANAAVFALERNRGERSALWTYQDANGDPVGVVVRWDKPGDKDILPVSKGPDGWTTGGMPKPRPLYCLPELADADRVWLCEGEKACDAGRSIGLTCTTSPHGSKSAGEADWSPLTGKEVVILPDHDEDGETYARNVVEILGRLDPPPSVRILQLDGLPPKGDLVDWLEQHDAVEPEQLRETLERMAEDAPEWTPDVEPLEQMAEPVERFQPFPTDALPEPIRGFVVAGAKAIGCDSSYLALPLLTALAAAIGNTRRIQLKRGWTAPAIIWTAIVGESGTSKTPAFKLVMKPIHERQRKALEEYNTAKADYDNNLLRYDVELRTWKDQQKKGNAGDPPEKPEEPQAWRCIVSDTTVEALAPLLLANPRGVLLARDELAGWIGSFDRYAGGRGGADAAHWLSMHNGESITVDRKTGNPRTIYVPQASVSVTGGIQPGILHRALGIEHRESGLAARLLLTCPPRKPKRWTEADVDPNAEAELARLVDRLYDLQPRVDDDDEGDPRPVILGLTPGAKAAWKEYYNHHAEEQTALSGDLAAAWSKLEEYAARLALVIHLVQRAADDADLESPDAVDADSMKAGIELAQWFKAEARRVYALLSESDNGREQRRLAEWIERKGGSVTAREVQQGHRQYRTAQDAEAALEELAKAGYGQWRDAPPGQKGGRPSSVFQLSTASTSTKPARTRDSEGFVDVDSVDTPETQPDDDSGRPPSPPDGGDLQNIQSAFERFENANRVLADNADADITPEKPSENGGFVNVNGVNGPDDDWLEL